MITLYFQYYYEISKIYFIILLEYITKYLNHLSKLILKEYFKVNKSFISLNHLINIVNILSNFNK